MHEYRHIISRMRLGESDRQIAKAGLMGRNKAAQLRKLSQDCGWLNHDSPLPGDEELAKASPVKPAPPLQPSSVPETAATVFAL